MSLSSVERNDRYRARHPERARASTNRWRAANPERFRSSQSDSQLKLKYELTREQWNELFTSQGSACGACGAPEPGHAKGWMTDHCHVTKRVRGILCGGCNLAAGHAKDDPNRLRCIADYLESKTDMAASWRKPK